MQQPEIIDIISRRKSVRTYDGRPLSPEDHTYVQALMEEVNNPFDVRVRLHLLDAAESHEKLSTYGIIRDARTYIARLCVERICPAGAGLSAGKSRARADRAQHRKRLARRHLQARWLCQSHAHSRQCLVPSRAADWLRCRVSVDR